MNTEENTMVREVKEFKKQLLTCDQVAWIMDALERFKRASEMSRPSISRLEKAAKTAFLLEIMELLHLGFEDRSARHNAIAHFGELYESSDESPA